VSADAEQDLRDAHAHYTRNPSSYNARRLDGARARIYAETHPPNRLVAALRIARIIAGGLS
jgi:hypothetical protein